MPRFIAVPVTQGDAFYLEREGFSALIDGGFNRSALPSMFQEITNRDGSAVIVCTHNDADHANGILGFLQAGLRCGEVWLPGRWLNALPDVLGPFVEVFVKLVDNIAKTDTSVSMEGPQSSPSSLEAYAERMHDGLAEDSPTGDNSAIA
jgi:glyoxylase-like metal-dependent hydrolase (beta-lactamase superfamily II)